MSTIPPETGAAADGAWYEYTAAFPGPLSEYDPQAAFHDGFLEGARWLAAQEPPEPEGVPCFVCDKPIQEGTAYRSFNVNGVAQRSHPHCTYYGRAL